MTQSPSSYINNPVSGNQYWSKLWTGVVAANGDSLDANVKVWTGNNGTGSLLAVSTLQVWNWHYLNASMSSFSGGPFNFAHTIHTVTSGEAGWYTQVSAKFTGPQTPGSFELYLIYSSSTAFAPTTPTFSPAFGGPGTSVTITGSRFTDATFVQFNGVNASFTVNSDTQITATVPSGAGVGHITVGNPVGSASSAGNFVPIAIRGRRSGVWVLANGVKGRRSGAWNDAQALQGRRGGVWAQPT